MKKRTSAALRPAREYVRPTRGQALIRFENLYKAFGDKVIYEDLSLTVNDGETLTVIGGSGMGKSVLLKCLLGLIAPDSGRVIFENQDLTGFDEDDYRPVRHRIAMVFQGSALFDSLTVGENIAYPIRERFPQLPEDELAERVHLKLDMVNLPDAAPLWPAELSGGMRKRVGLARAIAVDPEVILWDEPTSGLDPISTRMINDLILLMQKEMKTTSIVVTHDMASAERVSDRIAMLANHTIVEVGTVEQMRQSKHPDVRAFIHAHV
ncbi:MAG: ABC transporter ATP-binding protein [Myxococcaceae bacterium]|nr:ABC transporter ATP-binding protein [Myxococcaceae bacterium]